MIILYFSRAAIWYVNLAAVPLHACDLLQARTQMNVETLEHKRPHHYTQYLCTQTMAAHPVSCHRFFSLQTHIQCLYGFYGNDYYDNRSKVLRILCFAHSSLFLRSLYRALIWYVYIAYSFLVLLLFVCVYYFHSLYFSSFLFFSFVSPSVLTKCLFMFMRPAILYMFVILLWYLPFIGLVCGNPTLH